MALRQHDMTGAYLAELLEMDWHLAARLIDPKRSSKLTSLAAALGALGCRISISVETGPATPERVRVISLSDALRGVSETHGEIVTPADIDG
jgi:hypothetical protein